MSNQRGYTLVSQQIRQLIIDGGIKVPETNLGLLEEDSRDGKIKKGWFECESLEKRVQPGSFEPSLGDEVFVLDPEEMGLLRPNKGEDIRRTLLQIPARNRLNQSIKGGYELKGGFTYLIPLREKINPFRANGKFTYVNSSPKSSTGRLFPRTRLLADFTDSFDEIKGNFPDKDLELWLLLQPSSPNFLVFPKDKLNQLWFVKGDAKLTPGEIIDESRNRPIIYKKNYGGEPIPIELNEENVIDGLQLTLNLEARETKGIAGWKIRKNNPHPVDTSRRDCNFEEYHEPIIAKNGRITITSSEHYLFSSNEILDIPPHLSAKLRRHSHEGIEGSLDDAGFVDQGFMGDLVFEVGSEEKTKVPMNHGMPLSRLDLFRTSEIPDKIYGKEIGSHYKGQIGPKPAKFFKVPNFDKIAKNHTKLDRYVLVQDTKSVLSLRKEREGFELSEDEKIFVEGFESGFFSSRYDCEEDPLILQPIPYVILFGSNENVFSYIRSEKTKDSGDKRLRGKHSIGLGGHVSEKDGPDYIKNCLEREALKEETRIIGSHSPPRFVGTIFSRKKEVDNVHFGLIYGLHVDGKVESNEDSIKKLEMVPIEKLQSGYPENVETETWTELLIPNLRQIYELSKP